MSNLLEPGKYIGTVEDFAIRKSAEKGTPSLNVKFAVKGETKSVFWEKYITEGTVDHLADSLVESGLLNTKRFSDLSKGKDGGGLKLNQEVEIVIFHEEYTNSSGEVKTSVKVRYVNAIGGGEMKGAIAEDEAISTLSGLNIDAAIMQSEVRTGKKVQIEEQVADVVTPGVTSDDVPF